MSDDRDTARRARSAFPGWPMSGAPDDEHRDEITGNYSAFADDPRLQVVLTKLGERQKQQQRDIDEARTARDADSAEFLARVRKLADLIQKLVIAVDVHAAEDTGRHEHHSGAVAAIEKRLDRAEAQGESAKSGRVVIWAAIIGAFAVVLVAGVAAWSTVSDKAAAAEGRAEALQRELETQRGDTNARLDRIDSRVESIADRIGARPLPAAAPNP